jgi:decaprenylphospho-beta-D-ribofuranose 2-oxidase
MTALSGWGRYPVLTTDLVTPRSVDAARALTAASQGIVARGNGRAYGDAAIGIGKTLSMVALDRMRAFDPQRGLVTVEAGVLLADIIATFLPRGFFPKVVPGTRFVTVGGAIAADVHGKNHHRDGGFGNQVESLLLATGGGEVLRASQDENAEVFFATIGGMGLTGTILEATLLLAPVETGWIRQRTVAAADLAAALAILEASDEVTYSVAWIDCVAKGTHLGRSLVFLGEHARLHELDQSALIRRFPPIRQPSITVPFDFPGSTLNHFTAAAFNELYYRMGAHKAGDPFLVAADPYFFPLDRVGEWNRIYGRRGFVQHQCVLPTETAADALAEMLDRITQRGDASFLAVLKKLGLANGLMSFPMGGYTLALDFAVTPSLLNFLEELDTVVVNAGGRLYLAKDARQSRATFAAGYPDADHFRAIRRTLDPQGRIRSRLAERLGL